MIKKAVALGSVSSPFLRERLCMHAGVWFNALLFLPVLWRAPEPVALVAPVIFVPFLAGFLMSRVFRRRWPLLSVLASRAATVMFVWLGVATPLVYPRSFPPGRGATVATYLSSSAALTGAALVVCAGGFVVLRLVRGSDGRRTTRRPSTPTLTT